jgi:hypothetical protein
MIDFAAGDASKDVCGVQGRGGSANALVQLPGVLPNPILEIPLSQQTQTHFDGSEHC